MNIGDLIETAKESSEPSKILRIDANTGLDDIDCENIDSLFISYDYAQDIPSLDLFPNLKKLHINRRISLLEFEKLDLSKIEDLYVNFEKKEPLIIIKAPNLKKLVVYISNNEEDQITLFEPSEAVIDICSCLKLEELHLRHCTGYTIKTNQLRFLNKLICCDFRYYDFDLLRFTPNLIHLVATSCKLRNVDFVRLVPGLKTLDVNRNEIFNVDIVFEMKNIEYLNLYRNPLDNVEKYKALPYETYITEKDREFSSFKGSVKNCMEFAYRALKSARNPDVYKPPIAQKMYENQTDEQIFIHSFAHYLKKEIEERFCDEKGFRSLKLHTKEELVAYLLKEYPFLEGLL